MTTYFHFWWCLGHSERTTGLENSSLCVQLEESQGTLVSHCVTPGIRMMKLTMHRLIAKA